MIRGITAEDCRAVETGMTKCSEMAPGHDQPRLRKKTFRSLSLWRRILKRLIPGSLRFARHRKR